MQMVAMRVGFQWRHGGCCRHPEFVTIQGGSLAPVSFPAGFGQIRHPEEGWILFDTGYSSHFWEKTRRLPERLYALAIPAEFREQETAVEQLKQQGIEARDVKWIFVSHLHCDRVAGLRDFPNARILCSETAFGDIKGRSRFSNMRKGVVPGLLPDDFAKRIAPIEGRPLYALKKEWEPFKTAFDVLTDGSLLAVPLPGHARGQMGLILRSETGRDVFLVADVVWNSETIRTLRFPHPLTRLITSNIDDARQSILDLHYLKERHREAVLIPSHCREFKPGSY